MDCKVSFDTSEKNVKTSDLLSRIATFLPAIRTSNEALLVDNQASPRKRRTTCDDPYLEVVNDPADSCDDNDEDIQNENVKEFLVNHSTETKEYAEASLTDTINETLPNGKQDTVVMHIGIGSLDENPAIEMLAHNSDDSDVDDEND